mmetsp:Transcript_51977/g.52968  ORF Transcript_51977/g.52968 Transcript_51977/m.52968 type:complete len:417 (+) Transcript_51977:64-1314(+)
MVSCLGKCKEKLKRCSDLLISYQFIVILILPFSCLKCLYQTRLVQRLIFLYCLVSKFTDMSTDIILVVVYLNDDMKIVNYLGIAIIVIIVVTLRHQSSVYLLLVSGIKTDVAFMQLLLLYFPFTITFLKEKLASSGKRENAFLWEGKIIVYVLVLPFRSLLIALSTILTIICNEDSEFPDDGEIIEKELSAFEALTESLPMLIIQLVVIFGLRGNYEMTYEWVSLALTAQGCIFSIMNLCFGDRYRRGSWKQVCDVLEDAGYKLNGKENKILANMGDFDVDDQLKNKKLQTPKGFLNVLLTEDTTEHVLNILVGSEFLISGSESNNEMEVLKGARTEYKEAINKCFSVDDFPYEAKPEQLLDLVMRYRLLPSFLGKIKDDHWTKVQTMLLSVGIEATKKQVRSLISYVDPTQNRDL